MAKNNVQLPLTVTLSGSSVEFLRKAAAAKDGNMATTLEGWVGYWVDNQARGGLMIGPEEHDYLAGLNDNKRFRDSKALVRAVEKGLKREDGQFSFVIQIDPAFVAPLQEHAKASGMTVDELVQNSTAMVWASGWLYDCVPESGRMVPFTKEMLDDIAKVSGKKDMNSTDIGNMVASGQLIPVTHEMAAQAKKLTGKLDVTSEDFTTMMKELEALRAANKALQAELVAA